MANVFNTTREIKVKYDLKGSSLGRTSMKDGQAPDPKVALKDNDWLNQKMKVQIPTQIRNLMKQQLRRDAEFF
jgi:1-phosphatidylinositol-4-phosphate 5-kinase